jgi:hypothetical protein
MGRRFSSVILFLFSLDIMAPRKKYSEKKEKTSNMKNSVSTKRKQLTHPEDGTRKGISKYSI